MSRLLLLVILLAFVGGCRRGPDAPSSAGTDNPDVTTPAEVDPAVVPPGGARATPPSGEPGIPGSPRPEAVHRLADGACYVYTDWVVAVHARPAAPGENVAVMSRAEGADARALCDTTPAEAAFALNDATRAESFFGLQGNLLFIDAGTAPGGRELVVLDLTTQGKVLQTPYEEPISLDGNVLTYHEPVGDYGEPAELAAAPDVSCPQAEEWFAEGFGVGVNRVVRFDLTTRRAAPTDERVCVPLQ